jgi:serine/threonine-protein kinase
MSDPQSRNLLGLPATLTPRADQECDRFEAAWKAGQRPRLEDNLAAVPEPDRPALLRELLLLEVDYRRLAGERLGAEEFLARFPALDQAWLVGVLSRAAPALTCVAPAAPGAAGAPGRLGKFLLLQQIGKGGCGTVWRAQDTALDRVVALKLPDPGLMTSPVARARFRREARAVARLSHPNIVTLFDVEQVGATPLLVMEYVEGTDLGRLVERGGPLPVAQACDYVRQAALGLQHAHECGLVHRDVKPHNLLLSARGSVVKVLDLGLARLGGLAADADTALTESGCVMGTYDFMAPEQARDARHADARADLYGLGCSLYYLLTGRVPFPGGTGTEKLLRHVTEEPRPVEELRPEVPPALAALVRGLMRRRPEDRPQTAAAVVAALTALPGGELRPAPSPDAAPAGPPATATGAGARRRRWRTALLLSGFAVLVLLVLLRPWGWLGGPAGPEPVRTNSIGPEPVLTNSVGMKLVLIRPGRFFMGSPSSEKGRYAIDEGPRREVVLTRAFYIGVYEVTQGEYQTVTNDNPSFFQGQRGGGLKHPVEMVSYFDAVAFCERLSARPAEVQAGRVYRLPTEAEWEYVCRAGSSTAYHFGDDPSELGRYAWSSDTSGGKTHPVGQLKPNAWGVYDLYGNVWEWVADAYDPAYYRTGPNLDPRCSEGVGEYVLRGGGWGEFGNWRWCRSATRGRRAPDMLKNYHGLRVVCTVPGTP